MSEIKSRITIPSALVLENDLSELVSSLDDVLKFDPMQTNDTAHIREMCKRCKELYRNYRETNLKFIDCKFKAAATSEANELRNQGLQYKDDVKCFIRVCNAALDDDESIISFETSSVNNDKPRVHFDDFVKDVTALRDSDDSFVNANSKLVEQSRPNSILAASFDCNYAPTSSNADVFSNSDPILPSSNCQLSVQNIKSASEFRGTHTISTSQHFSHSLVHPSVPSHSTSSLRFTQIPLASQVVSKSSLPYSVTQRYPVLQNTVIPDSGSRTPWSAGSGRDVSGPPVFPSSYPVETPIYSTVGSFAPYSSAAAPVSFSHSTVPPNCVPNTLSTPRFLINSCSPATNNYCPPPPSTWFHRNDFSMKTGEPFDGQPHKYYTWINVVQRKITSLNLDSWDTLTFLHENTAGKPHAMIGDLMDIGAANPPLTLTKVWNALHERFGSESRIAAALMRKLDDFRPIRSPHHTESLGELINICHLITVNMPIAEELNIFNLSHGLRRIWGKLPDVFQNGWRTHASDYKHANNGSSPKLPQIIAYLERKYREFSDPCYEKHSSFGDLNTARPSKGTTLLTATDDINSSGLLDSMSALRTSPQQASPEESRNQAGGTSYNSPAGSTQSQQSDVDLETCIIHPHGKHFLADCHVFTKKPFEERLDIAKENRKCFACLGSHLRRFCRTNPRCPLCNGKHVKAMHQDRTPEDNQVQDQPIDGNQASGVSLCSKVCGGDSGKSSSKVLLVDLSIPSQSSKTLRCYAILDEQSKASFVDPKVVEHFGIQCSSKEYKLTTLAGLSTIISGSEISGLTIKGVNCKKSINLPTVTTNPFIPNCKEEIATPTVVAAHRHIRHFSRNFLPLDNEADVLVLIGTNCGEAMATRCYGYKAPYVHRTPLGWALVGVVCLSASERNDSLTVLRTTESSYHEHVGSSPTFLRNESPSSKLDVFMEHPDDELLGASKDENLFLQKVVPSIRINKEGSIVMPLPFKNEDVRLPDNKMPVYRRMRNTLNKLKKDPDKLSQCLESMRKNLIASHVEEVPLAELGPSRSGKRWYIPLFPVVHPKKGKVRLVFDSAASYQDISLNDQLYQGPDVNTQLTTVLRRFRRGVIGFTADIEAMFYAFHMEPDDRDFTRFFWWHNNDPDQDIVEFRATRHVFGNRSSPSIANIGLRFAVANSSVSTPRAEEFVNSCFYVDDGCGSADTVEDAIGILTETRAALDSFNIRLHKIASSSQAVTDAFPPSECSDQTSDKDFNPQGSQRTLGVEWNPTTDSFIIRSCVPDRPFTKRGTLATTNSLFDPLGFVAPVVLTGRLLQRHFLPPKTGDQQVLKLEWDDPLPEEFKYKWDDWIQSLRSYDGRLKVERSYYPHDFGSLASQALHVFSDASFEGIGSVFYLRSVDVKGKVHVSLVSGSSRVAPRNVSSMPRLELCAALDACIRAVEMCDDLRIDYRSVTFYCDSKVVLGYIANTSKRFTRYVTRRIDTILKSSGPHQWNYISTTENPGDIASRPQSFESLSNSCWFRGPAFLWESTLPSFQQPEIPTLPEVLDEILVNKTVIKSPKQTLSLLPSFSRLDSWNKLINVAKIVIDFIFKFINNIKKKKGLSVDNHTELATSEKATRLILITMQQEGFAELFNSKGFQPSTKLLSLAPFVEDSLIRVGGRLRNSKFPCHVKHPILLPHDSPATVLLIRYYHVKAKHQGRIITTSAIREAGYYIHRGSSLIKRVLRECTTCRKLREPCLDQRMADLPNDRLDAAPPFSYCGMDVFGPFLVTEGVTTRRSSSMKKTWAVIFICLLSKAIHVEPLPLLDTSSFKNALCRFFAIRGHCKKLRSDQGTNFVGVKNQELQALDMSSLREEVGRHSCEWEMNPPCASHFGGIWERAIRSIRRVLEASLQVCGKRNPSRDELHTFLQEAVAIVNNTPMYGISNDPNDPLPLTPAKILTLKECPNPPPLDSFSEKDILSYGSRRWRRVQAISESFWNRWRAEYLQELQTRQKWTTARPNLGIGDVVLMKIKNVKRNVWPLAKVIETKVSSDGLVRSVTLRVGSGVAGSGVKTFNRPVCELVPVLRLCEG